MTKATTITVTLPNGELAKRKTARACHPEVQPTLTILPVNA